MLEWSVRRRPLHFARTWRKCWNNGIRSPTDLVKRKCRHVSILQCMFRGWPFASPKQNEITTASKNGAERLYYIVANCLVKPFKTKPQLRSFYRNVFCCKEGVFSASRVCQWCNNYWYFVYGICKCLPITVLFHREISRECKRKNCAMDRTILWRQIWSDSITSSLSDRPVVMIRVIRITVHANEANFSERHSENVHSRVQWQFCLMDLRME